MFKLTNVVVRGQIVGVFENTYQEKTYYKAKLLSIDGDLVEIGVRDGVAVAKLDKLEKLSNVSLMVNISALKNNSGFYASFVDFA